ncbi:sigma-70 family RNA polymerase sigma factor [Clostridium sp. YIM B02505]|uniref:Sigma-70 family RNA polymerase sigma factor n=1 Tax=Clostridium yunnanense TaxID=2800325 RepID=A0ABS1ERZ6_9CLOT|nr:sigma-70 family RNA polymerase sigma factor [Clostridium yunnanense]MBK1812176.1 sigma-70 family RNA polymerase sigma factor [Clostridium yunnanense]
MDYEQIEHLVVAAKTNELKAKEMLMIEFTPFIRNLSRKSIVHGYDREDLQNECYRTLFKCIFKYNCENHRFVGYATNAIKNTMNNLIKVSVKRSSAEGAQALIMDERMENKLIEDDELFEDRICNQAYNSSIKDFISELNDTDKEIINFVFFEEKQLKEYSALKEVRYTTVVNRKNTALKNLKKIMDNHNASQYIN